MNKKLILGLLVVVGLFTITGCGSSTKENTKNSNRTTNKQSINLDKEISVNKLHFKYLSDDTVDDTDNGKIMKNDNYNIIVSFQKDMLSDEIAESKKMTFNTTKMINKVEWKLYDFKANVISKIYMIEKDGGTYVVTFAHDVDKEINLDEVIEQFMNNVNFK